MIRTVFRAQGLEIRVWGSGFRVQSSGLLLSLPYYS